MYKLCVKRGVGDGLRSNQSKIRLWITFFQSRRRYMRGNLVGHTREE